MREEVKQYLDPGKKNLILIYVLYLSGIIIHVLPVIGGVFAYANQAHENAVYKSHYIFAFRTFSIGLVASLIVLLLAWIIIVPVLYIPIFVWFAVRSIIALQYLLEEKAHPNPLTFWIK